MQGNVANLPAFRRKDMVLPHNPDLKNQRFLPPIHSGMIATGNHIDFDLLRSAPLHYGMIATGNHNNSNLLRSAPPLTQGRLWRNLKLVACTPKMLF